MKILCKVEKQIIISSHLCNRGYISQNLFDMLIVNGIHLITKIRNNMKNTLMNINDKILLRKRALIETIHGELKTSVRLNILDIDQL